MLRLLAILLAITLPLGATPGIEVTDLASPAGPNSVGPALTTDATGAAWLTWVESAEPLAPANSPHHHAGTPAAAHPNTLRVARFDPARGEWHRATAIASDATVTTSSADFPLLAFDGSGAAVALWTDGRGGAFTAQSNDQGAHWSKPKPWTTGHQEVEKFALTRLADGRVLAAWLDARGRLGGGKNQQLYARIVGEGESTDECIDGSVCDCCQTTLAAFLDGGALVAYRGRTNEEVRDILTSRRRARSWDEPRYLNHDDWRISACPVNGPRLSTDGSRVAAAWFTGADSEPRVLASYSPDAGARWLMPLRIDGGHPAGHVDVTLLRDGAFLVMWLESDGSLWLRRVNPEFAATEPQAIVPAGGAAVRSVPRMVLLHDYAGGATSALALLTYTSDAGVRTKLAKIAEGALLTAERHCDCTPTAEELQGVAIRGKVVAVDPEKNTVSVAHAEVPGIFGAGTHSFHVSPLTLASIEPHRPFLGRIERERAEWRLFGVRYLGAISETK